MVCTENLTHEDFAARLLSAGKHVIVEYPAALCEKGTRRLFQLAEVGWGQDTGKNDLDGSLEDVQSNPTIAYSKGL